MHQFFEPVIRPILEIIKPRSVVEIGSDFGHTTKKLLGLPEETCGVVHVIDPLPKYDPKKWREEFGARFVLHPQLSLNALGQIPLADAYFIDGDHNWFTVLNELRLIEKLARKAGREFPLVMLHDTGWPYGRRDLYYNPENIPDGQRQPYKKEGMLPGKSELAGQNGLNIHLNHSIYENETRNGVFTAVEDFVNESSLSLRLTSIDAFFGFTVLASNAVLEKTPALSNLLDQWGSLPPPLAGIIKQLESARVDGEIIKQKLAREQGHKHTEEIGRVSSELASTRIERDALRAEIRFLAQRLEETEADRTGLRADLAGERSRIATVLAEKEALVAEHSAMKNSISETKASRTHRLQDLQQAITRELARIQRQAEKLETEIAGAPETSWGQNLLSVIGLGQHYRALSMLARLAAEPGAQNQHPRRLFLARVRRHGWKGAVERLDKDYERALDLAEREGRAQGWQKIGGNKRHQQRMLWRLRDRAQDLANTFVSGISTLETAADRLVAKPRNADLPVGIQKGVARSNLAATSHAQVDIVIPVFNALADVGQCLPSVLEHTSDPYRIIIVNDASDPETTHWLRWYANRHPERVTLLENEVNQGYTRAINRGIQASQGAYVILLNSDTIVTPGWLDRLCTCAASNPRIGIVGPLSNAASWQNVPELLDADGKFAVNELPSGWIPSDMAEIVSRCAPQPSYPRVPFVNGFCYLIKREVIKAIGLFDEIAFPRGYGEENDYSLRCADAGFELAVAEDCYVFHAKSRSFGHGQRKELSQAGGIALEGKHGKERINKLVGSIKRNETLASQRRLVGYSIEQAKAQVCRTPQQNQEMVSRIAFLLPVEGGGGGTHSVVQEVSAMRSMGIDAKVVIRAQHLEKYRNNYKRLSNVDSIFLPFTLDNLSEVIKDAKAIVATTYSSVRLLAKIKVDHPEVIAAYYVQDYEPLFFPSNTPEFHEAIASYDLIPNMVRFAKTRWLCEEVARLHSGKIHRVIPSIDHEVYMPMAEKPQLSVLVICAMIRPSTPRRGAHRTMQQLKSLSDRFGKSIRIEIFGCDDDDISRYELERGFGFINHGHLTQLGVAKVLAKADVFLDLSDYQAFGRTAAEAMACGCVPMITRIGGAEEFLADGVNGYLIDINNSVQIVSLVEQMLNDRTILHRLREEAVKTACRYSRSTAALSELAILQEAKSKATLDKKPIVALIPMRQSAGALTASGHVRVSLPFQHPRISTRYAVNSCVELPTEPVAALVIQRHAARRFGNDILEKLREWQRRGTRIIFDLDDDLLDPEPLRKRMPGDNVNELTNHIRALASMADIVLVTTETLAERLRPLCGERVRIIPNGLDEQTWLLGGKPIQRDDSILKIGYIGSYTHDGDLAMIQGAIARISREYGKRVQFELIGGSKTADAKLWNRISPPSNPKHHEYPHFVKWLRARVDWHIGLAPLADEDFNTCKSPLKYFDYSALGLATICSDRPPYRGVVSHNNTGLLVPDSEDAWYEGIKKLIEDADLRRRLQEAAYADVVNHHTLAQVSRKLLATLDELFMPEFKLAVETGSTVSTNLLANNGSSIQNLAVTHYAVRPSAEVRTVPIKPKSTTYRKLSKLIRDPRRFLLDAKQPLLRRAGMLFWGAKE